MSTRQTMGRHPRRTLLVLAVTAGALLAGYSTTRGATASSDRAAASPIQAQIQAALRKRTTLTFWGWAPQTAPVVAAFEKAYPKVKVVYVNMQTDFTEYAKLQTALKAHSGIPDVAQFDYHALPQFVLSNAVLNLDNYGFGSMSKTFTKIAWSQVNVLGGVYGVPQDTGPLALFYNKTIFDKYGLVVPKTWSQYVADARKLHQADPSAYITADSGDPTVVDPLIWQAGGRPFQFKGTVGTVNLADHGTSRFAATYGQLLKERLVFTNAPLYTPNWVTALKNGTIASVIFGGWGVGTLEYFVPDMAGKWRVAAIPQYTAGSNVSAQEGGSSTSVMAASNNKLAAIGFAEFFSTDHRAIAAWQKNGGFPSQSAVVDSKAWRNTPIAEFGGQKANQILAYSENHSAPGWQYLPFNVYANSVFSDAVGPAFAGKISLKQGLLAWQKLIVAFGKKEGFTVN
jgi:multiple sugar transport system substrate-binding protein